LEGRRGGEQRLELWPRVARREIGAEQSVELAHRQSQGPTARQIAARVGEQHFAAVARGCEPLAQHAAPVGRWCEARDERSPDTDARDLACYLTEWAFALLASGQAAPAVPPLRRVLELAESARTPLTANVLSNLATACFESGALDEAIPLFHRALDLRHETAPSDAGTLDRASPAAHAP
jgi:tetratricopeptide (TPR) repeat protein